MVDVPAGFHDIKLTNRPLIVCDVDEVVLEFVTPLANFLHSRGLQLLPRSFRLHGNIIDIQSGNPVADDMVSGLLEAFFTHQDQWQTPAALVVETLATLDEEADIVFLTAMPPRHTGLRRMLLDSFGLTYPLLATEEPKGPVVERLHDARSVPLAFIDDIARNLQSVRAHAPDCLLINMMANAQFRAMAPDPGDGIAQVQSWPEAAALIRAHMLS